MTGPPPETNGSILAARRAGRTLDRPSLRSAMAEWMGHERAAGSSHVNTRPGIREPRHLSCALSSIAIRNRTEVLDARSKNHSTRRPDRVPFRETGVLQYRERVAEAAGGDFLGTDRQLQAPRGDLSPHESPVARFSETCDVETTPVRTHWSFCAHQLQTIVVPRQNACGTRVARLASQARRVSCDQRSSRSSGTETYRLLA